METIDPRMDDEVGSTRRRIDATHHQSQHNMSHIPFPCHLGPVSEAVDIAPDVQQHSLGSLPCARDIRHLRTVDSMPGE